MGLTIWLTVNQSNSTPVYEQAQLASSMQNWRRSLLEILMVQSTAWPIGGLCHNTKALYHSDCSQLSARHMSNRWTGLPNKDLHYQGFMVCAGNSCTQNLYMRLKEWSDRCFLLINEEITPTTPIYRFYVSGELVRSRYKRVGMTLVTHCKVNDADWFPRRTLHSSILHKTRSETFDWEKDYVPRSI